MQTRLPRIELLRPELGLWGGLLLLLSTLFMSSAKFADDLPVVHLPSSNVTSVCNLEADSYPDIRITEDVAGRIYMYAKYPSAQSSYVEYVAAQQGIQLNAAQRRELLSLPYIGLPVKLLPAYLNIPVADRKQVVQVGIPVHELSAYIEAAKLKAPELNPFYGPFGVRCYLRLDERMAASQVKQVFRLFEQRGIHRFSLMTEIE
ncbi:hypothetical protein [Hymenobacter metallilatus]|uniref:Uncharacterized protein n=1 Tax=Hymenobacter metallilatus TaxID=2493666 RepID=A0A3R9NLC1_9BACT|nr:hypothetical protein [Hymenobacter metallilatus]RSK36185.1 hypothetical protein EI290_04680 [Hymenobacter metallilatus]